MERRQFIKAIALAYPSSLIATSVLAESSVAIIVRQMNLALASAGRLSFYIDYSERTDIGKHKFYVCRSHGTSGSISVDYESFGDNHVNVKGTLTWNDGQADIKAFEVDVPTKNNGMHRTYVKLSNPTGGAELQNGTNTIAYGVIDDETIANNSLSVFFDTELSVNGDGSLLNPYNNIYDAIQNVGTKRYIYGKGTVTPNGTNKNKIGGGEFNCISPPASRLDEESRVFIMNWPGYKLVVDGAGNSNCNGFYTKNEASFQTFRGIDFKNINVTGVTGFNNAAAIFNHYGDSKMVNIEYCTADNINGSSNVGAFLPWGVDGGKIWRCAANNMQIKGDNTDHNTAGVFYYSSTNLSIQRCEFTNSANGVYMKRMEAGHVVASVRFSIFKTSVGILYGYGSTGQEPNFSVVQGNLFKNCNKYCAIQHTGAGSNQQGKQWICNNVFDSCGGGDNGAIKSVDTYHHQIFNNIFYNCVKMWDMPETLDAQSNTSKPVIEYANHNNEFGTVGVMYEHLGTTYDSALKIKSATGFAQNDTSYDPKFIDPSVNNYRLAADSPCMTGGINNVSQGIYLTGVEKLGSSDGSILFDPPEAPTGVKIT